MLNRVYTQGALIRYGVCITLALLFIGMIALFAAAADAPDISAKGMVTMIDLGADRCIPCKMMAPVLKKVKKDYEGRAFIHFYDLWKNRTPADRYRIRVIPTQIFFDKDGKEVYRHEGFLSEADIVAKLKSIGVK
ncbi:thioredoxin family protein [Desulfosoma sp.]|uniref:thioredoxin family protein n=1 Tax=Desulfosoma sp. TaxID=2603217 RepID=UPI00404AD5F9